MKKVIFLGLFLSLALSAHAENAVPVAANFESVKPVLIKKCAICHGSEIKRPLSSKIPIWNHATGTHIGLSRKKYNIDSLLEKGDAADIASMKLLEHVVYKGSMPPVQYKLLHPKSKITDAEREAILGWIYAQYPDWKSKEGK